MASLIHWAKPNMTQSFGRIRTPMINNSQPLISDDRSFTNGYYESNYSTWLYWKDSLFALSSQQGFFEPLGKKLINL